MTIVGVVSLMCQEEDEEMNNGFYCQEATVKMSVLPSCAKFNIVHLIQLFRLCGVKWQCDDFLVSHLFGGGTLLRLNDRWGGKHPCKQLRGLLCFTQPCWNNLSMVVGSYLWISYNNAVMTISFIFCIIHLILHIQDWWRYKLMSFVPNELVVWRF